MTQGLFAVAIFFSTLSIFVLPAFFPKARKFLITLGFFVLITGVLAVYLNRPPKYQGNLPPAPSPATEVKVAPGTERSITARSTDSVEEIIKKMGCSNCHQIPGIPWRNGSIGPILIEKTLAPKRIASPEYQARIRGGAAHAKTAKEYVMESILSPDSFIVPSFTYDSKSGHSVMYSGFDEQFSYNALEKLVDYLMTLDCESANRDGLSGPALEPLSAICGR